jgi:hypothetical protein
MISLAVAKPMLCLQQVDYAPQYPMQIPNTPKFGEGQLEYKRTFSFCHPSLPTFFHKNTQQIEQHHMG